jgi:hypothetical protein
MNMSDSELSAQKLKRKKIEPTCKYCNTPLSQKLKMPGDNDSWGLIGLKVTPLLQDNEGRLLQFGKTEGHPIEQAFALTHHAMSFMVFYCEKCGYSELFDALL